MEPTDEIKHAAELISFTLDSGLDICVEPNHLVKHVRADMSLNNGACITDKECELIVMGDDTGEIPEALVERFPNLNSFLNSLF